MTALFHACFGLCIIAGAIGSQLRRLEPTSPLRIPVDGVFAVTLVALMSLVEGIEQRIAIVGAVVAGTTTLSCVLMGIREGLLPIQRCIWLGVAIASAGGAVLIFLYLHGV